MACNSLTLIFFDLETAGPDPKRHPIIQIGAVASRGDEVIEGFEAKLQFDIKKANKFSLRKNNYRPSRWAQEAKSPREVAEDFSAFLKRHATLPVQSAMGKSYRVAQLVAHNAAYDEPFLVRWFEQCGLFLPAQRLVLCTLQLAQWHFAIGGDALPENYKLATLCKQLGVPFHAASAHDALADASATVALFGKLRTMRNHTSNRSSS